MNEEEKSRWFERFYDELRKLASSKTKNHDGGREVTLQPTALVNELFLKWHDSELPAGIPDSQLKGIAARALMQILLDHDRKRKADRRGGGVVQTVPLDAMIDDVIVRIGSNLESLQDALQALELHDPLYAEIVFRKFFSGESHDEIAFALGQTNRQIEHAWYAARDWLREKLNRDL